MAVKALRVRTLPSLQQCDKIDTTINCCRFVKNHMVERNSRIYDRRKEHLSYNAMQNLLPVMKGYLPWLKEADSQALKHHMRTLSYVRFLEGKEKDDKGRTIEDILGWEGKFFRLEFTQDYIQRIFPLPDGSQADKDVWPITAVELLELRNNEEAKGNIRRAYVMMLYFWKLDGDKYKDLSIKRHWVRRNGKDHNLFRISRVLKCLKLVHMSEYDDFCMRVEYLLKLSEEGLFPLCDETKNIWRNIICDDKKTLA